jgi:hypothetical protein
VATHYSNTIIKFADHMTVVGLIPDGDLAVWCQDSNLSLNVSKAKELIVDFRRKRGEHAPIHIDGADVERVESFKFLGIHITKDLTWPTHTRTVLKRARQCLVPFRRLKRFGMGPRILRKLYSFTIEGILTG